MGTTADSVGATLPPHRGSVCLSTAHLSLHPLGGWALSRRGSGMGWPRGPLPWGARFPLGSGLWNCRPWARARGVGRALGQPSRRRQAGRCPLPLGSSCRAGAGTDPGRQHGRPGSLVPRGLMAAGAGAPGSAPGGETGAAQSAGHLTVRALVTHGTDLVPTGAAGPGVHRTRVRTCYLSAVLRHRPLLRYGAAWPGPKARTPTSRDGPLGQLAVEVLATLLELPCFVGAFPAAEWPVAWTKGRSGCR